MGGNYEKNMYNQLCELMEKDNIKQQDFKNPETYDLLKYRDFQSSQYYKIMHRINLKNKKEYILIENIVMIKEG